MYINTEEFTYDDVCDMLTQLMLWEQYFDSDYRKDAYASEENESFDDWKDRCESEMYWDYEIIDWAFLKSKHFTTKANECFDYNSNDNGIIIIKTTIQTSNPEDAMTLVCHLIAEHGLDVEQINEKLLEKLV